MGKATLISKGSMISKGTPTGYPWIDVDANSYYNALSVANGGDIDAVTLYSITLDTLKGAIDDFFVDNKADGVWANLTHLFPYIGGTAATHAINAVTATSEQTYVGSPLHDATGMVLNGSTQYGDTNMDMFTELSQYDTHLMQHINVTGGTNTAFGARENADKNVWARISSTTVIAAQANGGSTITGDGTLTANNYVVTRRANNDLEYYENAVSLGTSVTTASKTLPPLSPWVGAANFNGGANANSQGNVMCYSVGSGLTTLEVVDYETNIIALQTVLGREAYDFIDADAEAYYDKLVVENGGEIDSVTLYSIDLNTFKKGIDDHVINLKVAGVWTSLVHYYPIIGGTDVTHAINMVNAVSELTYFGSPTHTKKGMVLNGTTQYADMNNNPVGELTANDTHLMLLFDASASGQRAIGSSNSSNNRMWILQNTDTSITADMYSVNIAGGRLVTGGTIDADSKPVIVTRTSATYMGTFVDGAVQGTIATDEGAIPNRSTYLGAGNNNLNPIYKGLGTVVSGSIGDGLTPTEVGDFNTELVALKTLLGR